MDSTIENHVLFPMLSKNTSAELKTPSRIREMPMYIKTSPIPWKIDPNTAPSRAKAPLVKYNTSPPIFENNPRNTRVFILIIPEIVTPLIEKGSRIINIEILIR
jgi:hypothetical protein